MIKQTNKPELKNIIKKTIIKKKIEVKIELDNLAKILEDSIN